jgi:enolase-phosphatase E1
MIAVRGVSAIVTDIEGTIGSIAFVHEVLFPYARARLAAFIGGHRREVSAILDEVRAAEGDRALDDGALVAVLERWIDDDRKAPPLKALQGMIWREGYESGELMGHVYEDAERGLRRWRAAGLGLAVYSSGSVQAQKLLFSHSVAGDLSDLFDGYFDTGVGPKTSRESYRRIAAELGRDPGEILFLSDTAAEIEAARAAGMRAIRIVREGEALPGEAASFDEIEVV